MEIPTIVSFTILGLLGGFAHGFVLAKSWDDLKKFTFTKGIVCGAIAGFLYYFMWSEWTFPNAVMAFFFGWWGRIVLPAIAERFKPK